MDTFLSEGVSRKVNHFVIARIDALLYQRCLVKARYIVILVDDEPVEAKSDVVLDEVGEVPLRLLDDHDNCDCDVGGMPRNAIRNR